MPRPRFIQPKPDRFGRIMASLPASIATDFYYYYGLTLYVESRADDYRYGRGWITKMPVDYGYILGHIGADGDEMDCYIGPYLKTGSVYVVDQNRLDSDRFDEHKCMIGYLSERSALMDYMAGHHRSREIFRGITRMTALEFHNWLRTGDLNKPLKGNPK